MKSKIHQYINHIFVINLDHRTDRLTEFAEQMKSMSIDFERYSAINYPYPDGTVGCGYSHLNVIKLAKNRGYLNVLIFEDDFSFLINQNEFEQIVEQIFQSKVDFDVIFFAYNLKEWHQSSEYPFLNIVNNSSTASCYLVNHSCYDKLIELYEYHLPILKATKIHWVHSTDVCWKELMSNNKWFATTIRVGYQRASYSDNSGNFADYQV